MADENLVLSEHPIFSQDGQVSETTTPEETIEEVPASQEDESQYFITIDRRKLDDELNRILAEDSEFRNIYNRSVGNNAARKYQPQIRERDEQIELYRKLLRREEYSKLTQEEVNDRFKSDPQFARDYSEVVHFQGTEPDPVSQQQAISARVIDGLRTIVTAGARAGLTQEDIAEIDASLRAGKYDTDETGQNLPPSMWQEMLDNVQADVTERIVRKRLGNNFVGGTTTESAANPEVVTPPVNETVVEAPVMRTDTARPDISNPGNRGVRVNSITMREFRALPIEEQIRMTPNEGDLEKLIANGQIIVEGLEGR